MPKPTRRADAIAFALTLIALAAFVAWLAH